MAFPFDAAIGAGASLVGSGLSFLGGQEAMGMNASQNAIANQNAQQQLAFEMAAAHNGIQWRVDDAKAAGISPLVALGAPTFNPGAIGISGGNFDNPYSGAAHGLEAMGQDLSRAAMVAQTEKTRSDTIKAVEDAKNSSALTASQIRLNDANTARAYASMAGSPSMPQVSGTRFPDGQGNAPGPTQTVPSKTVGEGIPGIEGALTPAVKPVRMADGGIDPQPSLGSSVGATGETLGYTIRNRLNPPAGYHVGWNGAWYPDQGSNWWDRPLGYSRYSSDSSTGRVSKWWNDMWK